MKAELAKHIALTAFRSSANLNDLIPMIREHCNEQEYQELLEGISAVAGEIALQILKRLYLQHPEIEHEIDRRIEEYGTLIVT